MNKTNAIRILEASKVDFTVVQYSNTEPFVSAVDSANKANMNVEEVFKTIAFKNSRQELFVFVLESEMEVSLKKARELAGCNIEAVHQNELKDLTGYVRGCCSPLGLKKPATIFIDQCALLLDKIYVSCGQAGMNVGLRAQDLASVAKASFADFAS